MKVSLELLLRPEREGLLLLKHDLRTLAAQLELVDVGVRVRIRVRKRATFARSKRDLSSSTLLFVTLVRS